VDTATVVAREQGEGRRYLRALDAVLSAALAHARNADPRAIADRWRGLYLDPDAVEALARGGGPLAGFRGTAAPLAAACADDRAFTLLRELYSLDDFAVAAVALATAPELDARYGRIFAFLQDDVTRRLPSPALAIELLCDGATERERGRLAFAPGATLARRQLLFVEPAGAESPLTAPLRLDPQIRQLLLGEPGVDPRLAGCCALRTARIDPGALPVAPDIAALLGHAAATLRDSPVPLRLALAGLPGCGQDDAAEAVAAVAGLPLLSLDTRALAAIQSEASRLLPLFRREALLAHAVVRIDHAETLTGDAEAPLRALLEDEFARIGPAVVLATPPGSWLVPAAARSGFVTVKFEQPSAVLRRSAWRNALATQGIDLAPSDADALATRFRLTQRQIEQAASQAAAALRYLSTPADEDATRRACFAAAPAQGGHELERLARRIVPRFAWADIVTLPAVDRQLHEICDRVLHGDTVLGRWRFADKLALGRGVTVLFAGPSGTGKTMAAEVVAGALGIDLFKIDLASVVSKYIGETEQNLDRVFRAAEDVNGILLFDEADALFGKRSEVQDSRDRYANLEISYLLQKMEEFEGVAILSSNLQKNLDDAFTRRLAFIVHFPFPEAAERQRIWEVVWPAALPREPGLRFDGLARAFKLSGGNIKSAALGAAYYAAAQDCAVGMRHVVRAIEREYQKFGRPLKPDEVAPFLLAEASG
jgi:hypothetical protein